MVGRAWRYSKELYRGWVEGGAKIDRSWNAKTIYRFYIKYFRAVSRSYGSQEAMKIVEEMLDMADPSETAQQFDRWAREQLRTRYAVEI